MRKQSIGISQAKEKKKQRDYMVVWTFKVLPITHLQCMYWTAMNHEITHAVNISTT